MKRSFSMALGSALLVPTLSWAAGTLPGTGSSDSFTLVPSLKQADAQASKTKVSANDGGDVPVYMDAAPADEAPNIHGFANISFGTSYITPRGLVVENAGVVIQPVAGLVLPIGDLGFLKNFTLVAGVWNSINSAQGDTNVGPWNEMDFFFSMSANVTPEVNLNLTYGAWNFPQSTAIGKPSTEHNLDLKISYADKWFGPDFSINPYVDFFYAISGSSTVVLGRSGGGTGYVEVGIVPTYTLKAIDGWPITLTFPTYVSVGPEDYWGTGSLQSGNFGVLSTAVNASVPLKFIPTKYGHWHADFGVQYYNLLNGTLVDAGTILSGNTERNIIRGYAGFGVGF